MLKPSSLRAEAMRACFTLAGLITSPLCLTALERWPPGVSVSDSMVVVEEERAERRHISGISLPSLFLQSCTLSAFSKPGGRRHTEALTVSPQNSPRVLSYSCQSPSLLLPTNYRPFKILLRRLHYEYEHCKGHTLPLGLVMI